MHPRCVPIHRARFAFLLALLVASLLLALQPALTSAHAELERSQPAQGGSLGSAPARVDLWFSEDLTPTGSTVKVFDTERREVDRGDAKVDPDHPEHLSVSLEPLPTGTYTVAWTSVSSDDGHAIHGTFTFSVGVTRLPGAAAATTDHPSAAAVALRWLVFLGLMIPAGWFLLGLLGVGFEASRRSLVLGGAALALLADLALLPVTAFWPGAGLPSQSLSDTFSIMPRAWLLRLLLEAAILAFVAMVMSLQRKERWTGVVGALLTGAAVYELGLTSHAAARSTDHAPALAAEIVHLESVAFWIGGLALLAMLPKGPRAALTGPTRRFSRLAFVLAPLAIASGVLNAGITLPSFASLSQSGYGKILLVKIVFVAGILTFAWLNRKTLQAGAERAFGFVRNLRIELAFGASAILVASILSLWSPPQPAKIIPLRLSQSAGDGQVARVVISPVRDGSNQLDVWLTGPQDKPVAGVDSAVVQLSMLERDIDLPDLELRADPDGHFTARNVALTVQGWWDLKLSFTGGSGNPASAEFFVTVPDPVLSGGLRHRDSDPAARAVFESALDSLGKLTSMRAEQALSDGVGNNVDTDNEYEAPNRFAYQTSSNYSSIAIGDIQWFRQGNLPWEKDRRVNAFDFPHTLTTYYDGATDFTLGRSETIDGEECRVITFFVPAQPRQGAAWYAWWVGSRTHLLRREAMVADHHYMINHNVDFNSSAIAIAPPETQTP